jgi:hypothetical protein
MHLGRTLSSLKHRNYRLLFFGTSLSHVGDFIQAMAQSWLVWTMTGRWASPPAESLERHITQ